MSAHATIIGTVATVPKLTTFDNGGSKASFRLAANERRLDRATGQWVEGSTNWFSVNASRELGEHVVMSLRKGDRIVVTGKLRVRQWETAEGRNGYSVDIDAEGVGHDLRFGTSAFTKKEYAAKSAASSDSQPGEASDLAALAQVEQASWAAPAAA